MTWEDGLTNSQLAVVILLPLGLILITVGCFKFRRRRTWQDRYHKVYGPLKAPQQPESSVMKDWKGWKSEI